ncbi:MAG: ABC transporter permease [Oscillatoria sp. PMC 1051.18]|uniref:ABC transporter permease n=1 Tax=Oscillatoria salina TaxID=331517 RepID=UPI0013B9A993|nr:ABC transporter permease [Oscillatoria salina]MBZ8182164.1 ABC transporter permease [Oscillatoria salina IIICB1]MEC4894680.1 ABC transporter permease [Oscillatoria sp. PMC 1050.18]MEC5032464.1 ABC transporter permease [Oscillatoria sp. PMC 1051.18]NET89121.1 ABC transporter permease [Kamptonema sp. SIO1D9]
MNIFVAAFQYAVENSDKLISACLRHLELVAIPLIIGMAIGLPLGLASSQNRQLSAIVINSFNGLRVIPSLAILFLTIPYFGLTFTAAAIAITLLVIPPILINTDVAFRSISPAIIEAAKGMGMSPSQILTQIKIPLALPIIIGGIKTAVVEAIASATLAAFIGVGGLGDFIVLGFALYDNSILLVGAIPVAILALTAEISLSLLQHLLQPAP